MNPTEVQGMYVALILPSMFGLVLTGEGVWKVVHQRLIGFISIFLGMMFMMAVGIGYLLFVGVL
ncbi:hypothetical protein A2W24_05460 [Microgenomates group bacterium RBG_16_45_19]|nr:MAG: hypothetical protein A2W24_05460 [Microgenomates group bacterium RBG_16_45_19]